MYCKKCGSELEKHSNFCSKCGTQQNEIISSENMHQRKKSKNKFILNCYNVLLELSKKKYVGLQFSTLLLLAAVIFPVILLPLITAFLPLRIFYILIYIISFLFLFTGIILVTIECHKDGRDVFSQIKNKFIFVIPYTIILILLISIIGFFEAPPSNQLVGYRFTASPTEYTRLNLSFRSNYVNVWIGTYKDAPNSPSGKILDEGNSVSLKCSYDGKSTITIGKESFYGVIDKNHLSFPNTAEISLSDTQDSAIFRDAVRLVSSFKKDPNERWYVENNWDYFFKITDRRSGNVMENH